MYISFNEYLFKAYSVEKDRILKSKIDFFKFKTTKEDFDKNLQKIFDFNGRDDLDYSIWTKDCILLFEAKSVDVNQGLDVGWHKMAFPATRFFKYTKYKIKPVYFLKWDNIIHLFVFPDLIHHDNGVILNDKESFRPERIFRIVTR